jgi:ABC-2 type transport system permease protein
MMTTLSIPLPTSLSRRSLFAGPRALQAVIRKEWIIFRRYPSWLISMIIWPVIFPAAYILSAHALAGPDGSGLALFSAAAGTSNYLGFIVVGTTVWMWQNIVLWNVGLSLRNEQLRGVLESNWLSPTDRFSFLLGAGILHALTSLLFIAVSFVEFALVFHVGFNGDVFKFAVMLLASIPAIYGIGFVFASLVIAAKEANAFVFLVRGAVMVFCGITFPVSVLPGWMQGVATWLPQTYAIRGIRNAVLAGADWSSMLPDLLPLLGLGIVWLALGYWMFNWMERRARRTGAIGQY